MNLFLPLSILYMINGKDRVFSGSALTYQVSDTRIFLEGILKCVNTMAYLYTAVV